MPLDHPLGHHPGRRSTRFGLYLHLYSSQSDRRDLPVAPDRSLEERQVPIYHHFVVMFDAFTSIKLVQARREVLLIDTDLIVEEVDPHILVILRVIILAPRVIALP